MTGVIGGGIRTSEDLMSRCFVDEAECWHWRGARDKYGRAKTWFEPFGVTTTIGPVIGYFRTGRRPPKMHRWTPNCGAADCVNPFHWKLVSHSEIMSKAREKVCGLHNLKLTLARRARAKLNASLVTEIRASQLGPLDGARKYGISVSTWYRTRNYQTWRPLGLFT